MAGKFKVKGVTMHKKSKKGGRKRGIKGHSKKK